MNPIVIIGTGLAGYNLAKEIRKLDSVTPLLLLSSDDGRNYSKPMLSTGFTKKKTADQLAMASAESMAEQLNAVIRTHVEVTAIDTSARRIHLGDEVLEYRDLVIAAGAEVIQPPLKGDAADEVYTINDLMDYAAFRAALVNKKHVLIIGAGLIGCEFANDLRNGDFQVTVADPIGRCLPALLPEECSSAVERGLTELGVDFRWGQFVTHVNKLGSAYQAVLADGSHIDADMVVSAIGLRPRTRLAEAAGIAINRGVVVDRTLKTSANHVYSLGDCSEVVEHVMLYVLPLMAGARTLAKTLSGTPTEVVYGAMPVSVKTPCCPVVVSPVMSDVAGAWSYEIDGNNVKALFHDDSGALKGFALTGTFVKEKNTLAKQVPVLFGA